MRDYIVVETLQGDTGEWRTLEARLLATGDWIKAAERRRFSVFLERAAPPTYRHLPGVGGALIGDVFDADAARQGRGIDIDLMGFGGRVDGVAARLVDRAFGRYVAILNDDVGPMRVLRDPLGAMDAIGWRHGGLRLVASRLPDLPELWPADLAIDWSAVAAILRQKNLASLVTPLKGLISFAPGVLAGPDGRGPRLWSPAAFAAQPIDPRPAALRTVVDGVVAAWAHGRDGIFCEISGGLDSAIVATSLAQVRAPLRYGLNQAYPQAEGDERAYAQAVADAVQAPLEVVERTTTAIDPEALVAQARGVRVSFLGGDPAHEADLAARLADPGIDALFTGRGGDGCFFQPATPALVGDILKGVCGPRLKALAVLARRNSATVWSILKRSGRLRDLTAGGGGQPFLSALAMAGAPSLHPWLADARTVSPAKQLQILMTVNVLSAFGESQSRNAGDVVDPLLSQPVVEFCLATPAGRLALGPLNRPFARQAFAERLPPEVRDRTGKGEVTGFVARRLEASLPAVRPFLLEGQLAKAGLLDLAALDAALTRDTLIWSNVLSPIFVIMAVEAWTRRWSVQASHPRHPA